MSITEALALVWVAFGALKFAALLVLVIVVVFAVASWR
jgi:hypothetical protein